MDDWRWWPQVLVRGAGFPADGVLRLADEALAVRADALAGADRGSEAWRAFGEEFAEASVRLAIELQSIASRDDFLRAVTWQNHPLMDRAIRPFLRWDPVTENRSKTPRRAEQLIASYWQRYCVKNDTIGFFGPSGWGRLGDDARTRFAPGDRVIRSSEVFFEAWTIDRLAEVIEELPGMREWLMPRRLSFIKLDGTAVVEPVDRRVMLSGEHAGVLRWCDGTTRAHDIALRADLDLPVVLEILQELERRRWICWKLELPISPWPERDLRRFLAGVGEEKARDQALEWLDSLEAARDQVRDSTSADALAVALTALDEVFGRITGAAPVRNQGRTYGGRTLAYHDSARDIDLVLGDDLVAAARPLRLLSRAARWYCWRVGAEARQALRDVYARTAARYGQPVDLATIWSASLRALYRSIEASMTQLDQEFTKKWAAIIAVPPDTREVRYRYEDLLPLVDEAFAAPGPGWAGARYFCPDVMVSATDLNALHDGDFTLVLGEAHIAINTLRTSSFVTQHPDEADLLSCVDEDFPGPRLLLVLPKENPPRLTVRTHPALIRDRDILVEVNHHTIAADRPGLVLSRDVEIVQTDATVLARLPGGQEFELLDLFAEMLMTMLVSRFQLFADWPHTPRVTIDQLVISRESWRFNPAGLDFAAEKDEAARYVRTRAWAAALGIPRQVFVKSSAEVKPVYVDFTSPVYVNTLAKMIRQANADERLPDKTITIVEMLPAHDGLWLTDHEGNKYTSELRFTWVDDRRPEAAPADATARAAD
ncbi:MAG TPA: lantibiotic dehydratase [Streptosporangiaceae bacterium]|nr:lantibiotic dehydratase [Streptosporangiaceae bacterium]